MSGCLTLKFSGSWKTVLTALSSVVALVEDLSWLSEVVLPSTGEMGMVSRGTCWEGFGAVATSAIVIVVERVEGWWLRVVLRVADESYAIAEVVGRWIEVEEGSLKSRRAMLQG